MYTTVGVKPVIQPIRAKKKVPFTLLYCDKY